jgi:hypothetical protein
VFAVWAIKDVEPLYRDMEHLGIIKAWPVAIDPRPNRASGGDSECEPRTVTTRLIMLIVVRPTVGTARYLTLRRSGLSPIWLRLVI